MLFPKTHGFLRTCGNCSNDAPVQPPAPIVDQQADAALQQATFQCDQVIMGREFEYSG